MADTKKAKDQKPTNKNKVKTTPIPAAPAVPAPATTPTPLPAPPYTVRYTAPPVQTPAAAGTPATPAASVNPPAAPAAPEAKKSAWPWILGGCLALIIITLIGIGILGWLGMRSVKNMLQKYEPTINQTQKNIDDFNKEAAQWQAKSQQFRESMPNPPDDFKNMQGVEGIQGLEELQNAAPEQY